MDRKKAKGQDEAEKKAAAAKPGGESGRAGNGSWQKIEALREKAALKASLADVWDEDFDLDDEILAELDHTAEFFTSQEEAGDDDIPDDDEDVDEFYEDEDV